jgi:hypothetical protein
MPNTFSQAAHLVLQINALAQQRLAAGQQCPDVVALKAFHIYLAVPAGAQDLGNAAGVVLVRLVAHGAERRLHMTRLHNHCPEAGIAQTIGQPLCQRTGFKSDSSDLRTETAQAGNNLINFRGQASLKLYLAIAIDNA